MDSVKIGKFIQQLRKERNMTQQELAEVLNVTNKAISRWETGEGFPEITLLPSIAEVLVVSVEELLNGEKKLTSPKRYKKQTSLYSFAITFLLINVTMFILSVSTVYATYYEIFGVIILLLSVLITVIVYIFKRSRFLSNCEYVKEDKRKIFISTFIMYSHIILVVFCFTPLIILDPNLHLSGISTKAVLSFHSYFYENASIALLIAIGTVFIIFVFHSLIVYSNRVAKIFYKYFVEKRTFFSLGIFPFIVTLSYCLFIVAVGNIGLLIILFIVFLLVYLGLMYKIKPTTELKANLNNYFSLLFCSMFFSNIVIFPFAVLIGSLVGSIVLIISNGRYKNKGLSTWLPGIIFNLLLLVGVFFYSYKSNNIEFTVLNVLWVAATYYISFLWFIFFLVKKKKKVK